ncbi:MAG: TolB family protein [Bellilinea sp.]
MKQIAVLILLSVVVLSGCGIGPKGISSATGEVPAPEITDTAAPVEPAAPTEQPDPTVAPTDIPAPSATVSLEYSMLAYVGRDGNIYLKDLLTGKDLALTDDATFSLPDPEKIVEYHDLAWSSDGLLLAFQRLTAAVTDSGRDYQFNLWVFDVLTGSINEVLTDVQTAGFAWRPGTHQLTYALTVQEGYFTTRAEVNSASATGIFSIDVDAGSDPVEIVTPSGGFSLVSPQWSADGRILAFSEIFGMEGTGNFAYYDFDAGEYVRREQQVGNYDLMPDGSRLVFDTLTYIPGGMERIWIVNLDWTGAQRISPHYGEGYAFGPKLSPDGQQVAYWKGIGLPGEPSPDQNELFVQPVVETNDPKSYGMIKSPYSMEWVADGKSLLLNVGDPEKREIITIRLEDAFVDKLADGTYPAMRP